jgi:G patch domain-containing protein 1
MCTETALQVVAAATFRDGRPIVSGFVLFEMPLIEDRWYVISIDDFQHCLINTFRFPIPDIPKGWTPDPRRVWATDTSNKENESAKLSHPPPSAPQDRRALMKGKTADEVSNQISSLSILLAK